MTALKHVLLPARGLDLERWWPDLQRLVVGRYGAWIRREGLDPDDVVQEVARRVLVANAGRNPYDPGRCSPAVYLLIQARSAIGHLVERRRRWDQEEHVELWPEQLSDDDTLDRLTEELTPAPEERPIVRLYLEGHRLTEIVLLTGARQRSVAAVIQGTRARAQAWMAGTLQSEEDQ